MDEDEAWRSYAVLSHMVFYHPRAPAAARALLDTDASEAMKREDVAAPAAQSEQHTVRAPTRARTRRRKLRGSLYMAIRSRLTDDVGCWHEVVWQHAVAESLPQLPEALRSLVCAYGVFSCHPRYLAH